MVVGLILVPIVSLCTKKPDTQKVDAIFSCYQKTVTTTVRDSLGE